MNVQNAFSLVAVFYAVANLASMGLELNLRETIKSLRSVRVLGLTLGWSWLVGPALAVLLTKILPMAEPYAVGLLIFGLAPTAPMLPILIRSARADISLAAAIMPLAVVSTVILMPLLAPLLIPGLTLSSWDIGKPLLLTVLLPLVIGVVIRSLRPAGGRQDLPGGEEDRRRSPPCSCSVSLCCVNWRVLLSTLGSFAIAAPGPVYPRPGAGGLQLWFRTEPGPARGHGAGGLLAQWQCHAGGHHRLSGH